ncbi:MAG: T9SS type A sorting domain-containing protein [Ignavibacteria bacterium]
MKSLLSILFAFFFFSSTNISANNDFSEESRDGVGFFKMERVIDHYYGNYSYQFEIHSINNGWVQIKKNITPTLGTNEAFILRRLVFLSPLSSNTCFNFLLSVSSDGQNFYDFFGNTSTTAGIGEPWTPCILPFQGTPGNIIAIRIKFLSFYSSSPFSDSINSIIKLDYWCASQFSYPIRIIEDFENVVTTITPIQGSVPEKFSLSQNYPNPFNPKTNINFQVPKTSLVTLKVYDVLGREVVALVNEKMQAGSYKVDFDGSRYTSGTYFYRLETDGYAETKKMLLIK